MPDDKAQSQIARAIETLRVAGAFFSEVAFAHRRDGRTKNEERVRATASSLAQVTKPN